MRFFHMILVVTVIAFCGCRSGGKPSPETQKATTATTIPFYYAESEIPPHTYKIIGQTTVVVTRNMFTDINLKLHEAMRQRARAAHADAILVGELGRTPCPCPACRQAGGGNNGPHVSIDITLLQRLTPPGTGH